MNKKDTYLHWARFYRDDLDLFIAPVECPRIKDGHILPSLNGKEKYYKVMPIGYRKRYHGKDDYLRDISDEEVEEWFTAGYGLAVVTKGWSNKHKKFQRIFDIDSFGSLTKEEFWKKYANALSGVFVTESYKGYHLFVFSDVEMTIGKFTIETKQGDTFTGELRYGPASGHTVEPPSLSVDDRQWVVRGEYKVVNFTDVVGDLPAGWRVTNFSAVKNDAVSLDTNATVDTIRAMLDGKSRKGEGQGVYNINLAYIGSVVSKIKSKDDIESVQKALDKVLAFNKKHTLGYPEKEIQDTFYSVLKKDLRQTKMNKVELDMETIRKSGGTIIQDSTDGVVYIQVDGKHNYPLKGGKARRWIIQSIEPKDTAQVGNLVMRLDAAIEHTVQLRYRVTRNADNAICYNIGDDDGTVVTVKNGAWLCEQSPDVRLFKPSSGQKQQVIPILGGDIYKIFDFVNIREDLRPLFICLVIFYFVPDMQYPILSLYGSKGSGKSTAASFLRSLVDPNEVVFDSVDPKKPDDTHVMLSAGYLTILDNLSHITQELSDILCMYSTGGAYRKRELYTNGDLHLSQMVKPVVLTGVTQEIRREDLLSRVMLFEVQAIVNKKTPTVLQNDFIAVKPYILGAIFDVLSQIDIRNISDDNLVRMSDFHKYARGIGAVLGFNIDEILQENYQNQETEAISNSDIAECIRSFMATRMVWEGTAGEWLRVLAEIDPGMKKKNPVWFSRDLRRLGETLQIAGLVIEYRKTSAKQLIIIKNVGSIEDPLLEEF